MGMAEDVVQDRFCHTLHRGCGRGCASQETENLKRINHVLTETVARLEEDNKTLRERELRDRETVINELVGEMQKTTDRDFFREKKLSEFEFEKKRARDEKLLSGRRPIGNAVTEGRFMAFGTGATQLMNALVYALPPDASNDSSVSPARVYKTQTELLDFRANKWEGNAPDWINSSDTNFREIVISPNNPERDLQTFSPRRLLGHLRPMLLLASLFYHPISS
ncbi:L-tryptophan--pyruvate aminotransferase 1-like [Asparagus officinalis]|uniref:L-tryptophan--pyruvate aminotransferase 1-like n=1 Tax=Asparagus officinalis TaxID=4686 RepID=UPI00098DE46F|nr:L-tryptophan--pyruvate aminotransferase 1-like [Asparagus officinalis]